MMREFAVVTCVTLGALVGCGQRPSAVKLGGCAVVYPDAWRKNSGGGWGFRTAQDLTNALFRVTGQVSPLVAESESARLAGRIIFLGDLAETRAAGIDCSAIPKDEAEVRVTPDRVYIAGQDELGPSNGIIEFLQRYADWYFATIDGCDTAPFNPDAEAPVGSFRLKPAFSYRMLSLAGRNWKATSERLLQKDFSRRLRIPNYLRPNKLVSPREIAGVGRTGHSYYFYLWPKDYFADHPDYYSMGPDGKRHCTRNVDGQLCLSNPKLLDQITANMLEKIAEDRKNYPGPEHPLVYDFSQNDNMSYLCKCENCRKIIARYNRVPGGNAEGGDAGLQLEFVNALARRVRERYPDVLIRTFAYVSTEVPPVGLVPEPNVMIWLCDLYSKSCHYLPLTHPFNRKRLDVLESWRKIAQNLDVWDYWLYDSSHGGGAVYPEMHARALAADLKLYASSGIRRVFCEAAFERQCFYELHSFVAAQCFFHPDADVDRLIRLYCRVYGAAADDMEVAIRFLDRIQADNPPASEADWHARILPYRTTDNWTKFRDLCEKAYRKADTIDGRTRIAAILASTSRELMRLERGHGASYDKARADFVRYSKEGISSKTLAAEDVARALEADRSFVEVSEMAFRDLPKELSDVPKEKMLFLDHHFIYVKTSWERCPSSDSETGICYRRRKDPADGADAPYECLLRDARGGVRTRYSLNPQADGKWHWYRLGRGRIGQGARFFVAPENYLSFELQDFYINCDGLDENPNCYDVWISVKFGGKPTEDEGTGLFVDRLALRRVPEIK